MKIKLIHHIGYLIIIFVITSCSTSYKLAKELRKQNSSESYFKGFVLYDPIAEKELINIHGNKYFTPASNTKLYTFYTAYKVLKDSIKSLEYYKASDSLIIKGTADPALFYGFDSTRVVQFLKKDTIPIYMVDASIDEASYGSGWAWDDYPYYYMPEKSLFPVYGNIVRYGFIKDSLVSYPNEFLGRIKVIGATRVDRDQYTNQFYLEKNSKRLKTVPFTTYNELTASLLAHKIDKNITLIPERNYSLKPFYGTSADSLYKQLLVVSDNFIAEQLLLQVGQETTGYYNVEKAIAFALKNYLFDLPQKPRWVDGSGLSRYNLFTPEDMVVVLHKMYKELPTDKLLSYFPIGGESGTLKNWYGNDKPFVYAKSGTLSNNYNLSGYIITAKGRLLIFSAMHNHFMQPLQEVKKEMEQLMQTIYKSY